IQRRPSSVQRSADVSHQVGNVVVVANSAVEAYDDSTGFETVKSRRTSVKEKKESREAQGEIMSVLVDWVEPAPKKAAPAAGKKQKGKPATPTQQQNAQPQQQKTQPQQQKAQPAPQQQKVVQQATKHIQANKQGRAKLAS
ncbi:hypothetical protein As57867_002003, partial [Aphanomyces stellatus]